MGETRDRRPLWWAVMVGGSLMLLAALVLAVTSRGPADFGEAAPAQPSTPSVQPTGETEPVPADGATTDPADPAGQAGADAAGDPDRSTGDTDPAAEDDSTAQGAARTIPLVPVDARRPARTTAPESAPAPVGLQIPALDLAVDVVPVGVADDGQMEIPESGYDVGWYRYGVAPGEGQGSAVLASHVDTLAEGLGVLARIGELRAGDIVAVTLEDGSVADYEVTGRRTVPKADLDVAALFDRSGPARLALVTCGGPWQPERSSYRDNVIVTAEPVSAAS